MCFHFSRFEDRKDRHPQEEQDGDFVEQAAPPADIRLICQVSDQAQDQGCVQKDQLCIEGGIKGDGHAQDGREDDRRMAKDHGHDKPDEDGMQGGIVIRPCVQTSPIEQKRAADPQPEETGKKTEPDITGERVGVMDGARCQIIFQEPQRERQQGETGQAGAQVEMQNGQDRSRRQCRGDHAQRGAAARGWVAGRG